MGRFMQSKLYLINNGLKDLLGHFYETALAIAEAARDAGLKPVLAAHVSCPAAIVPDWLDFHADFTTDHWMNGLPLPTLPPADSPRAYVHRGLHASKKLAGRVARRALSLRAFGALRASWARLRKGAADPLAIGLAHAGVTAELEYLRRFRRDLEHLLIVTGCRADDHVFLPTAHARELVAILDLAQETEPARLPMFHLEFRHTLDGGDCWVDPRYRAASRAFFCHARTLPASPRVRLYTDTDELAQEYHSLTGCDVGVLPIPFRARLLNRRQRSDGALCIGYVGEARREKGFPLLAPLVEALADEYLRPGRVRFLIQGTMSLPEYDPESRAALSRLKTYPEEQVRLVGVDRPLTPDEYYRTVSETDLLLCPYSPIAYRTRSSGCLTEAVAAGIPTVVPDDTWLARNQPPGTGETFRDVASFIEAVRRILTRYPQYRARGRSPKDVWLATHSPANLVQTLLGEYARERVA